MRQPTGTGEIGDGVTLMVTDGVVGEIGSVRKYDPVNPCDIAPLDRPSPSLALFLGADVSQAMIADMPEMILPMTGHQRLYLWPDEGVGPVNLAGSQPEVSKPPVEVPAGQDVWPVTPPAVVPIDSIEQVRPATMVPGLDSEYVVPARGMSLRPTWTVYKKFPWTPTAFIRNVQPGGDSRRWFVAGVTRDGAGDPLGGCEVILMQSDKIVVNPDIMANPVVADVVSDGSGNFSVQVRAQVPHQAIAYKAGGPDVAGVTVNTIIPTEA